MYDTKVMSLLAAMTKYQEFGKDSSTLTIMQWPTENGFDIEIDSKNSVTGKLEVNKFSVSTDSLRCIIRTIETMCGDTGFWDMCD